MYGKEGYWKDKKIPTEIIEKMILNRRDYNGKNNPNWKDNKHTNYCQCGKEISIINKFCIKCLDRNGVNNPFYNKKHSDKTKKIMSEKRTGKYYGEQNIPFEIDNIPYNSLGQASNDLNIPITTIRWRLKSNNKKFIKYKYNDIQL